MDHYALSALSLTIGSVASGIVFRIPGPLRSPISRQYGDLLAALGTIAFFVSCFAFVKAWGAWPGLAYLVAANFVAIFVLTRIGMMGEGLVTIIGGFALAAGAIFLYLAAF